MVMVKLKKLILAIRICLLKSIYLLAVNRLGLATIAITLVQKISRGIGAVKNGKE
jgi:hypothetical protein